MKPVGTKLILVVEDDWHLAVALGARLRASGYDVLMAPGPSAGSIFAQSCSPDLIITDLMLPGTHGLTLMRELREGGLTDVPFIVVTANHETAFRISAMELGAAAYFEKPYDPASLMQAVTGALNRNMRSQPGIETRT